MYAQSTRSEAKNVLQIHKKTGSNQQAKTSITSNESVWMEKKLSQRLLGIILIWFIGWTPFAFVAITQLLGYGTKISKLVSVFAMISCKLSSVMNAYIYGMR